MANRNPKKWKKSSKINHYAYGRFASEPVPFEPDDDYPLSPNKSTVSVVVEEETEEETTDDESKDPTYQA